MVSGFYPPVLIPEQQQFDQPMTRFGGAGSDDARRVETDSERQRLFPRLLPPPPQADLVSPSTPQVFTLDSEGSIVGAVSEYGRPVDQAQLALAAVPRFLPRAVCPPGEGGANTGGAFNTGVSSVSEGGGDDPPVSLLVAVSGLDGVDDQIG